MMPGPERRVDALRNVFANQRTTEATVMASAIGLAALSGLIIGKMGTTVLIGLLVLPVFAVAAIRRPVILFYTAVLLAIAAPYSISLGASFLTLFRAECLMAIAYLFLSVALERRAGPAFRFQDWAVLAYVGAFAISPIFTEYSAGNKLLMNAVLPVSMYFVGRRLTVGERQVVRWLLLVGAALGGLTVLYELIFLGSPLITSVDSYHWKATEKALYRPGGIYSSPPLAAAVLMMCVATAAPLYLKASKWRPLAAALALVAFAGAFMTFTRAPLIGLGVGALIIFVLGGPTNRRVGRAVLIAVVAVVTLELIIPAVSNTRVYQQGIERPGQLAVREDYWRQSLPTVFTSAQTMIFGHGAEFLVGYRTNVNGPIPFDIAAVPLIVEKTPHNQYVLTAIELGISGFILLVVYLLAGLIPMLRIAGAGRSPFQLEAASIAAGIVVAAAGMYAGSLLMGPTLAVPLALVLGLSRSVQVDDADSLVGIKA